MHKSAKTKLVGLLAVSLSTLVAGCSKDATENRSLYSVRQPVVERSNYIFDVATSYDGVPVSEQQRLAQWFESIDLGFGDRVAIDDSVVSPGVRDDLAKLAGRYGLLLASGAPVTQGSIAPGAIRVTVTRSRASVPNCPNWEANSDIQEANGTYPNFGCAVNGNLAAMVANPEDLIHGQQGSGETTVVTSTKAIKAYRDAEPTGKDGLPETTTKTDGDN